MTVAVRNITFDCSDARKLAAFWSALFGWNVYYDDDPEVVVAPSFPNEGSASLLFIPVPEGKTVKNRLHLDVQPQDCTRDEQVERVLALGGTVVEDFRTPEGLGWVTMADPEGNEFCVERSRDERAQTGPQTYRLGS